MGRYALWGGMVGEDVAIDVAIWDLNRWRLKTYAEQLLKWTYIERCRKSNCHIELRARIDGEQGIFIWVHRKYQECHGLNP